MLSIIPNPAVGQGEVCGFWGCRARRNDAECDHAGLSSTFRRKMRPRSGMQAPTYHKRGRTSPSLPDPRFAGPLGQRSGAPFHSKELQRSHVPQKTYNPPCSEFTKKVKVKCRKKS